MASAATVDRLALAERHVADGLRLLDRQVQIIADLTKQDHNTGQARAILDLFLSVQDQYEDDLARLRAMA